MSRKLILSPAKINAYLDCKLIYFNNYIRKIGRFYYRPNIGHAFGASLHRALDDFHKNGAFDENTANDLIIKLSDSWTTSGYSSSEEQLEYLEKAKSLLTNYYNKNISEPTKTIATEKTLTMDMGDFKLLGRIDRIDELPDKHIRLVDYKSGRENVTKQELKNNIAMQIYALLAANAFPDYRISTGIYCIQTGNEAYVEFTSEEKEKTIDFLHEIAEEISKIDKDTVLEPPYNPDICPSCNYYRLCARRFRKNL